MEIKFINICAGSNEILLSHISSAQKQSALFTLIYCQTKCGYSVQADFGVLKPLFLIEFPKKKEKKNSIAIKRKTHFLNRIFFFVVGAVLNR